MVYYFGLFVAGRTVWIKVLLPEIEGSSQRSWGICAKDRVIVGAKVAAITQASTDAALRRNVISFIPAFRLRLSHALSADRFFIRDFFAFCKEVLGFFVRTRLFELTMPFVSRLSEWICASVSCISTISGSR
jgi:hypothetical protein